MKIGVMIMFFVVLFCFIGILYWLLIRPWRIHREAEPFREAVGEKLVKLFRVMFVSLVKDRFIDEAFKQKIEDGITASAMFGTCESPQCLSAESLCDLCAYLVSIREIEPDQFHTKQYVLNAIDKIREIIYYRYENCSSVAAFQGVADAVHDQLDAHIRKFIALQ